MHFFANAACRLLCLAAYCVPLLVQPSRFSAQTLTLSDIHHVIWDPSRSRLLVSAGCSVLFINPEAGLINHRLTLGAVADKIAVSGDGRFLYAAVNARGVVARFQLESDTEDLEIALGTDSAGLALVATSMVALPNRF